MLTKLENKRKKKLKENTSPARRWHKKLQKIQNHSAGKDKVVKFLLPLSFFFVDMNVDVAVDVAVAGGNWFP